MKDKIPTVLIDALCYMFIFADGCQNMSFYTCAAGITLFFFLSFFLLLKFSFFSFFFFFFFFLAIVGLTLIIWVCSAAATHGEH